jgi:hypothetical protein
VRCVTTPDPAQKVLLNRLLRRTEFNGSSVADMIDAATPVPAPVEL